MPKFPVTAPRAASLTDRVFSRVASRVQDNAGPVFPLHVGDTYLEPFEPARAEMQRTAEHPGLHTYSPPQGEPELLAAIGAHLQRRGDCLVDRECIQVMSGATAGLSVVCDTLLGPGDEVLLPSPYWPLIRGIIQKSGATPVEVPIFDRLDEVQIGEALEAAVTPQTAAIYVNSPHNPTGRILSDSHLAAIADVAEMHDLWVITDEVYEELAYVPGPPAPIWARSDFQLRTVSVHSMSKAYGLAGARVGWAHGPHEAMRAIRGVQTFTTYCAAKPMQLGAARALTDGKAWLDDAREAYRAAGYQCAQALDVSAPEGGTFIFLDVRRALRGGETALGFLDRCLEAGVLLTPGVASGRDFDRSVRLCFTAVPPADLARALERLVPLLTHP